jgi:lysozyme
MTTLTVMVPAEAREVVLKLPDRPTPATAPLPGALLPGHEGIDVSQHNGVVNWQGVARAGKRFAAIRVSVGQRLDALGAANWAQARAAQVWRMAYHYFVCDMDGAAQAEFFVRTLRPDVGECPPVLDVEPRGGETFDDAKRARVTDQLRRWLRAVEDGLGVRPLIYTNAAAWHTVTTGPDWAKEYGLWVARYALTPPSAAQLPAHFGAPQIWQYTAFGQCSGVAGNVDGNRVL